MELIFHKGENNKRHEGLVCPLDRLLSNGVESQRCVQKKSRGRILVIKNDIEITGKHDHVPNPAKIEMKQSLSEVRQRLFQSRYTPRLIKQETLSEEAVAELSSYSSVKRMIQKKEKKWKHDDVPIPNQLR